MASYSVYNYLAPGELPSRVHSISAITNSGLAALMISDAERVLDVYAGPGPKFYPCLGGETAAAVASGSTTFTSAIFGDRRPNYWAVGGAYVTIVSSTESSLVGARRLIVASANPNTVTLASAYSATLPAGSQFRFEQESAFPRIWDQDTWANPYLDDLLKEAVAAQVEYGIAFGSEAFGLGDTDVVTDKDGDITSRTYGSGYSEARDARRREGLAVWIAPRARVLLRRLVNTTGYSRG